ncbi:MAG: HAMP domain-containing sensor histidine kinase [bacterium]
MSDTDHLHKQLAEKDAEIAELKAEAQENKRLRELDEMKSTFVSTASHQLRTPLSVIKWVLSVLESDTEIKKNPSSSQMVSQASQGVDRIVDVVNDLLNLTRIKDGRLPFNAEPTEPSVLLEQSAKEREALAASREIAYSFKIEPNMPKCQLDPILVKEAMRNLLNNAFDYSGEKGKVSVTAAVKDDDLTIVVTNTGPGILKEEHEKIFEPFFRSPKALQLHPDGSGLGLYLTKAIVTEHGGTVSFTSEPDKETVFTVSFPMKK